MTIATRPHETVQRGCTPCEYGAHTECSACGCAWERDVFDRNSVTDACSQPCACHDAEVRL